jgi:hypothetical protein
MVFVMNGRPAMAFTSEKAAVLGIEVFHTSEDTPDRVDCRKLADTAHALKSLIENY